MDLPLEPKLPVTDNNWNDFASRQSWSLRGIYDAVSIDHFALCECSFRQIIEPRVWDIETYRIFVTTCRWWNLQWCVTHGWVLLCDNWLYSSTVYWHFSLQHCSGKNLHKNTHFKNVDIQFLLTSYRFSQNWKQKLPNVNTIQTRQLLPFTVYYPV